MTILLSLCALNTRYFKYNTSRPTLSHLYHLAWESKKPFINYFIILHFIEVNGRLISQVHLLIYLVPFFWVDARGIDFELAIHFDGVASGAFVWIDPIFT